MNDMTNDIEYAGARFYKCALQVNPYTYGTEYRGGEKRDEEKYNAEILEQCEEKEIDVVGLADHGSVENSESLRKLLAENDIVVFPGFEISSSEKVHMVCLYPESTSVAQLDRYLGQLMGENAKQLENTPTHPSSLSCQKIAQTVLQNQEGFWYAAHATGNNGLLKMDGRGGNLVHVWKDHDLVRAVQIPGKVDELSGENLKKIIGNKDSNYHRERPIAIINAQDVESAETLASPSASCRIKMTRPTFEAFCTAFQDPDSRIRLNHEIPERHYSRIESVRWEGAGFFGGMKLAFSENLNAVIGGRGTGKSTLIEGIRYALGIPGRASEGRGLDELRKSNMDNSRIILEVLSQKQQGQKYTISRRYGEQPIVKNADGDVSHLTPEDVLPGIEILGQNEILAIPESNGAKLALVRSVLPSEKDVDERIEKIKRKLKENREKLFRASEELGRLESAIAKKPQLEESAGLFKKLGLEKKLKNADLLAQEKSIGEEIQEQFERVDAWLDDCAEVFDLEFFENSDYRGLPNKDAIEEAKSILVNLKKSTDTSVKQMRSAKQAAAAEYEQVQAKWAAGSEKVKDELIQAISQLPEQVGKSGRKLGQEYSEIAKQLADIGRQEQAHRAQKQLVDQLEQERASRLEEYRQTAFSRFETARKAAEKLNRKGLRGKVRINLIRCGDVQSLKDFLQEIHGIGRARLDWLDAPAQPVDLVELAKLIEKQDADTLREQYTGMSATIAEKLLTLKQDKERLLRLEEIELKDIANIELNVSGEGEPEKYVLLDNLSTGQKCTAILNLLLLSDEAPLIIDQPEDHLDNAFIADRIVSDLRKLKTKRQFLFSTHNANIPVFGDAELIAVLRYDQDGSGKVLRKGSIDDPDVKKHSADILEGGKAAFSMRKVKYGF
ncbi:MAG: ATPase [Gammaproteobacteria bacterium]|nr:ATPase [Gammaproteobacteria bacterium]MDA8001852.1 ATPase [Alphaproteobacteria bacterium]MDA8014012.1 ATPase [Gammaproteobacteria bacterium]